MIRRRAFQIAILLLAVMLQACTSTRPKTSSPGAVPVRLDLTSGMSEASLHAYIGRQVIVTGFWNGAGKESGYVYGRKGMPCEIYVKATRRAGLAKESELENNIPYGTPVQVEGVLRYWAPPPASQPGAVIDDTQAVPDRGAPHLYFDVEQARVVRLHQR